MDNNRKSLDQEIPTTGLNESSSNTFQQKFPSDSLPTASDKNQKRHTCRIQNSFLSDVIKEIAVLGIGKKIIVQMSLLHLLEQELHASFNLLSRDLIYGILL